MKIDTSREAVERILEGVTPGPWGCSMGKLVRIVKVVSRSPIVLAGVHRFGRNGGKATDGDCEANARFIAASRELVPALLAERDAALAEVTRLTALLLAEYERGKAEAQVQGDTFYILEWMAGARPPVHPNPMRGRQSFRTPKEAIAFFKRQASDAQFLSLTKRVFITEDCTPQALALLTQEGR